MEISAAEWEIMRVLWAQGPSKSTMIYHYLNQKLRWSESTVKTLLARLVTKGVVETRREGRSFIYTSLIEEDKALENQVTILLNRLCQRKHVAFIEKMIAQMPMTQDDWNKVYEGLWQKNKDLVAEVSCDCWPGQCACSHQGHEEASHD